MASKSHHPPHDPNHPAMPDSGGVYPPLSAETGAYGQQAFGQHEGPVPQQEGYPEFGGYGTPYAQQAQQQSMDVKRPGTVLAGCIMAWLGSAFGIIAGLVLVTIGEDSALVDEVDLGASRADAVDALHLTGGFLVAWCLIVAVLAVFAFRAARWAAIALLVMAGIVAVLGLINLLSGAAQGVIGLVWSIGSALLIYRNRPAKQWFAGVAARRHTTHDG